MHTCKMSGFIYMCECIYTCVYVCIYMCVYLLYT